MIGLIISVPILTVALLLLTSADEVFGGFLQRGFDSVMQADGSLLLRPVFALILTLMLFSRLYQVMTPADAAAVRESADHRGSGITVAVILAGLDLVYGAFAVVQIRYLFMGIASVHMAGGYAAYARSGFFQLVALAVLTLLLICPALSVFRKHRVVRVLCALTALLTVVIDVSAFFRMRTYIEAYGLSLLRTLTLWAMAMILLCLLAVLVKAFRPGMAVSPAVAAVVLGTWVALNYANVDRIVAVDQVSRYNAGKTEWTTISQLISDQSPDALPAYALLANEGDREEARKVIRKTYLTDAGGRTRPSAYDWSFTWLWVDQ